ncbi:LysE family transporter [Brevibacillus sp. GCM10020057]|uniref:LysE family transporter n=1 Tax=Brevibacillus sp. GCM10020057 TaxID=3317327 RepID=UPI003641CE12
MALWDGLLFGMMLQLSVGPVCLAVLERSVTHGFRQAWWMAAGVALVDAAYMAGAMTGLALLLQIPLVKNIVVIGGAAALVWFGIGSMRTKAPQHEGALQKEPALQQEMQLQKEPAAQDTAVLVTDSARGKALGSFGYGVVLTMSNPLTILFWAGVFGSLLSNPSFADKAVLLSFAAGCVLATLLFLTAVSVLGRQAARLLRPVWLQRLHFAVGLFLIGFAIRLLAQNSWGF